MTTATIYNDELKRDVVIELRAWKEDGRRVYGWFQREDGASCELTTSSKLSAIKAARRAWPDRWNLRLKIEITQAPTETHGSAISRGARFAKLGDDLRIIGGSMAPQVYRKVRGHGFLLVGHPGNSGLVA